MCIPINFSNLFRHKSNTYQSIDNCQFSKRLWELHVFIHRNHLSWLRSFSRQLEDALGVGTFSLWIIIIILLGALDKPGTFLYCFFFVYRNFGFFILILLNTYGIFRIKYLPENNIKHSLSHQRARLQRKKSNRPQLGKAICLFDVWEHRCFCVLKTKHFYRGFF